jgi:hypothetical protein
MGLIGGIARTAVVAGTATAVSGRVQRRQAERFAGRDAQIYADRQQAYQQVAPQPTYQQPVAPAPAAAPSQADVISQLQQLGELKAQGILTDAEFQAQKAKLLG